MQKISLARRLSQIFLWLVPFLPFLALTYRPGGLKPYAIAVAAQVLAMAVWILAADAIKSSATDRRALLLPGVLLIACWASAAVAVNMGPPPRAAAWVATRADQHMRYVALLVAGLLAWSGLGLLTARLREAGERLFSVLGLSAATISTSIFTLFTLAALTVYDLRAAQEASSGNAPEWWPPLSALFRSWVVLFAVLTYLAASLYAMSLGKVGLLRKFGRVLFLVLGMTAAVLALIAVTLSSGPVTPGQGLFVLVVPAVPFILPYLIGVNLVRRAGDPS